MTTSCADVWAVRSCSVWELTGQDCERLDLRGNRESPNGRLPAAASRQMVAVDGQKHCLDQNLTGEECARSAPAPVTAPLPLTAVQG